MESPIVLTTQEQLQEIISTSIQKALAAFSIPQTAIQPVSKDDFLTTSEVKKRLNISTPTLRKITKSGKLTSYNIGGNRLRYKSSEVDAVLSQVKQPAVAA